MKNLLRILMFVLIVVAVFFASDFLMNQNENYDVNDVTNVQETVNANLSGEDLTGNLPESGEEILSGEAEVFSGEVLESGENMEVAEIPDESEVEVSESGDEIIESGEIINN